MAEAAPVPGMVVKGEDQDSILEGSNTPNIPDTLELVDKGDRVELEPDTPPVLEPPTETLIGLRAVLAQLPSFSAEPVFVVEPGHEKTLKIAAAGSGPTVAAMVYADTPDRLQFFGVLPEPPAGGLELPRDPSFWGVGDSDKSDSGKSDPAEFEFPKVPREGHLVLLRLSNRSNEIGGAPIGQGFGKLGIENLDKKAKLWFAEDKLMWASPRDGRDVEFKFAENDGLPTVAAKQIPWSAELKPLVGMSGAKALRLACIESGRIQVGKGAAEIVITKPTQGEKVRYYRSKRFSAKGARYLDWAINHNLSNRLFVQGEDYLQFGNIGDPSSRYEVIAFGGVRGSALVAVHTGEPVALNAEDQLVAMEAHVKFDDEIMSRSRYYFWNCHQHVLLEPKAGAGAAESVTITCHNKEE